MLEMQSDIKTSNVNSVAPKIKNLIGWDFFPLIRDRAIFDKYSQNFLHLMSKK